jgi:hypothetical protein
LSEGVMGKILGNAEENVVGDVEAPEEKEA